MQLKKIWANLAVANLDRTTKFYTELGFTPNGSSPDLTSFRAGEDGFIIHFFRGEVLKANVDMTPADLSQGNEIIFTLSADSRAEVQQWEQAVRQAGGSIVSPSREFGAGYYGLVFADPDGHRFNVFHM